MIPGMNSRQAQQMMKRMGIQQKEIDADIVIIRSKDKEIIIRNPEVSKINMMGQETFQVVGNIEEKSLDSTPDIDDEDINTVMEQTNCSKEEAIKTLEETKGDIAEAIIKLTQ